MQTERSKVYLNTVADVAFYAVLAVFGLMELINGVYVIIVEYPKLDLASPTVKVLCKLVTIYFAFKLIRYGLNAIKQLTSDRQQNIELVAA